MMSNLGFILYNTYHYFSSILFFNMVSTKMTSDKKKTINLPIDRNTKIRNSNNLIGTHLTEQKGNQIFIYKNLFTYSTLK